jgi:hypothetical protein
MAIAYRMHTKADEPALIKLWSEHGGWDRLESEAWDTRLLRTPAGDSTLVIAEDTKTGKIAGQVAFLASLAVVDGREVTAARPFTPIFAKELRGGFLTLNPREHPVARMYRHGLEALGKSGVSLAYALPAPFWARLYRMMPIAGVQVGSFPLWSLPLPLRAPFDLGPGYVAAPLEQFDDRVNRLWSSASRQYGCMVVRDARSLPFKAAQVGFQTLGIEREGELVGLVASGRRGDRQWLIGDLLAIDGNEALRATLAAVSNLAHSVALTASPEEPIRKVALLTTSLLEPVARGLGFVRDNYDFPLVVNRLDSSLPESSVAPERWYVSPND